MVNQVKGQNFLRVKTHFDDMVRVQARPWDEQAWSWSKQEGPFNPTPKQPHPNVNVKN